MGKVYVRKHKRKEQDGKGKYRWKNMTIEERTVGERIERERTVEERTQHELGKIKINKKENGLKGKY